jgi:hypothetical protein
MATVNSTRGRKVFDLSIMYSLECDLCCSHCMYGAGPDVKGVLHLAKLKRFIATWDDRVNSVGFYGGEVTLHLDAYALIGSMLPAGLQRWMFSNGTWSTDVDRALEVLSWTVKHRVSPLIVSGTKYHVPHQNRNLLENLAKAFPNHVWLKGDEDRYLPMGRLSRLPFSCTRRCERDEKPTRVAVKPDGSVIFQTCDGVYPIIGDIGDGFPELASRCEDLRCGHK